MQDSDFASKASYDFTEKAPTQMFDRVLNSPLITSKKSLVIFAKLLAICLLNLITFQYCAWSNPRDLIFNIFNSVS